MLFLVMFYFVLVRTFLLTACSKEGCSAQTPHAGDDQLALWLHRNEWFYVVSATLTYCSLQMFFFFRSGSINGSALFAKNNNQSGLPFSLQAVDLSWRTELLPSYKVESPLLLAHLLMVTLINAPDQCT